MSSDNMAGRDILAFIDCPSREVAEEHYALLHKQLIIAKDSFIISGLMQYFFESNSPKALDLLLTAPPHHDNNVLAAATAALKRNRFQVSCLLFHGLRRNPAPSWLRLLPRNSAIRDLLAGLDDKAEPTNLVAGVMVAVALVTAVPSEVGQHCLGAVLETFWRLLHCVPVNPQDSIAVFLRVTLFSLFTRLYALYPCSLVNFIRTRTINQSSTSFFVHTLKPMIERVRLHPMLFTFTKEAEHDGKVCSSRDHESILMYSSTLTLDPVESSCERPPLLVDPEVCSQAFVERGKCWVHATTENFFWSPSHIQSPNPIRVDPALSALHTPQLTPVTTPIYARTPHRVNVSMTIPESPPEAAVEATPETTPYTTPLLSDANRQILAHNITQSSVPVTDLTTDARQLTAKPSNNKNTAIMKMLSAVRKDREEITTGVRGVTSTSNDIIEPRDNNCGSSVPGVRERNESNKENIFSNKSYPDKNASQTVNPSVNTTNGASNHHDSNNKSSNNVDKSDFSVGDSEMSCNKPIKSSGSSFVAGDRARKKSVFVPQGIDMLQFTKSESASVAGQNTSATASDLAVRKSGDASGEQDLSLDVETETEEVRKLSTETFGSTVTEDGEEEEDQGLGPPPPEPYLELMKSVRSNRLRFLSQCGPPLDQEQIASIMPDELKTKRKSFKTAPPRSQSCSNLHFTQSGEGKEKQVSFLNVSKDLIGVKVDAETQTQEVLDPYETLTESFITMTKPSKTTNGTSGPSYWTPSPHELLENYIRRKVIDYSEPLFKFDASKLKNADEKLISQVHSMFCLLLLERQKREVHANRNRRLLVTSKKMHEQAADKTALTSKLEAYLEEIRDLKLHNQYMSSCYQKMKEAQDRDNNIKQAVLKEQGLGAGEVSRTVVTSLSRTVKTSAKGEETKEKVVVVLHKESEHDSDLLKDDLFRSLGAMGGDLRNVKQECAQLCKRVSELEKHNAHLLNEQVSNEQLQNDQEAMHQIISVAKAELTLKDEMSLVLEEQLNEAKMTIDDLQGKYRLEKQSWIAHERQLLNQSKAMLGVTSASSLRLKQLEQQDKDREDEHVQELTAARRVSEERQSMVTTLEKNLEDMKTANAELEARLKQTASERDVFQKELHLLKSRTGYSRAPAAASSTTTAAAGVSSSSANSSSDCDFLFAGTSQGHFCRAATSELKPLSIESASVLKTKK